MYYRRDDSRMGDEIFAMGALIAPIAWKIVKHGQAKAIAKKEAFEALPEEKKQQIKYKRCAIGEKIARYLLIAFVGLEVFAILAGHFPIADIMSFIPVIVAYFMLKAGKNKYETDTQTTSKSYL
ncbi:hypothetical protein [[Eubacterium] hominis]|uniref:hypothetical protein n=1 Tax=[Eubacterium] hominis TaxID=2764325 RepID=UPI003A4E34BD